MAHPRRIVPEETYLITRRCAQRTFRLRPHADTNQIFIYCLALAAQKTGVRLHAACVMSNHHHLIVTDADGNLPDFLRELHRLTAKAINAVQGQWENLWAAEQCSIVRLVTDEDIEEKIAYVLANPVAAGLVRTTEEWPGVLVWGERQMCVRRPSAYFEAHGVCPVHLSLVVERPPIRTNDRGPHVDWLRRVQALVAQKVAAARAELRTAGRAFLGRDAVLATSFTERATTHEAKRTLAPTFAAHLASVRDALRRTEQGFRLGYRRALAAWAEGVRDVVFPFGTWIMRVQHRVAVAPPLGA